ncbi:hypothetical protein PsYK624_090140 [Phanerochaete sordida]|uniref:ABM domain-containing protein n=1 Tax=Phanerochaete sordida TaxID=48140 RepID=A0A9P3GDE4_9APHY|nr:hypothetical protein PsYK624_090140 [Phanerochaete sordida]
MAPCLEIMIAKPTEAFRKDPTLAYPIYEICAETEGCLGIFYGFALEDPDVFMFAVPWASLAHHEALRADSARYAQMAAHFACVDVSTMHVAHVTLDAPLAPVLRAPCVSYVHVKSAAPGRTRAELERATAVVAEVEGVPGCTGGGWAKMYEREEYVLLHGWEDPKYHAEAAKLGWVQERVRKWREVVGEATETVHIPLTAYKEWKA